MGWGGFLDIAQALPDYAGHYSGSSVKVMNLTRNTRHGTKQYQDQLVYGSTNVPDGGVTAAMLIAGIGGLVLFRRFGMRKRCD